MNKTLVLLAVILGAFLLIHAQGQRETPRYDYRSISTNAEQLGAELMHAQNDGWQLVTVAPRAHNAAIQLRNSTGGPVNSAVLVLGAIQYDSNAQTLVAVLRRPQ